MDPDAFHELALSEVAAVHRLAYHLTRNAHEADDLVQETYLRALRSAGSFQPGEHGIRPWLFKILHNCLYTRRTRNRRADIALRRLSRSAVEEGGTPGGSPTDDAGSSIDGRTVGLDWDGLDERLCRAIRGLPVAHRTVILMAAVEEMTYREIADAVGVPIGTVMSRLSRARAALAAQLPDLAAELNVRPRRPGRRGQPSTKGAS